MEYELKTNALNKKALAYILSEKKMSVDELTDIILHTTQMDIRYKFIILNADETTYMEIQEQDIEKDSISYSEKYEKGERKSLSFSLINTNGKYTPTSNKKNILQNKEYDNELWADTKIEFYIGFNYLGTDIFFKKGIFCITSISGVESNSESKIDLTLSDKYSLLSGKQGTLLDTYEIPVGSEALKVIRDLFNMPMGTGYLFDYKPIIYDNRFKDFKTQATIRKDSGDTISSIIDDIATQMSANYYYNDNGNFVLEYLSETTFDTNKITCWNFYEKNNDLFDISYSYNFSEAINIIKVIGDNVSNGLYFATVVNNDPRSPICTGRIGNRKEPPITNCNVWNDHMAQELAIYHLRKKSLLPLSLDLNVKFNPFLVVDYLCTIENPKLNLNNDKCIINSISLSANGTMSVSATKINELEFLNVGDEYNGI